MVILPLEKALLFEQISYIDDSMKNASCIYSETWCFVVAFCFGLAVFHFCSALLHGNVQFFID